MDNISLFEKTIKYQDKITFTDLLSGIREKHSQQDRESALLAGTMIDTAATESVMLQKWRPPWLYFRFLIAGIIFSAILIVCALLFKNTAIVLLSIIIPSCVVPIALMIFFWEMNAPRNISIFQLIACFLTGGVFSILVSLILFNITGNKYVFLAPLAEEPGKLIISLFLLFLFSKKNGFKIYGMTGLTIGAAVGAGFAAFETAQYVYGNGYETLLIRTIGAFSSHVLYCAPYMAVAALLMGNYIFNLSFFKEKRFWLIFGFSVVMHGFWNFSAFYFGNFVWLVFIVELVLEWRMILKLIQDCFRQIAGNVHLAGAHSQLASNLKLKCLSGVHSGKTFAIKNTEVMIGTDGNCNLSYPLGTAGISDRQCKLIVQNGNLYLADAGSTAGTYLNGIRLQPLKGQRLKSGDVIWLGSESEKFLIE